MLDTVSKSMTRQGLEALDKALQARVAARAEGREEVEYTPPSEAEFAAAVAKDMAGEVFSSPRVVWIAVAVIVIVVIVAVALISRGGV
jgi:hypothetical protein